MGKKIKSKLTFFTICISLCVALSLALLLKITEFSDIILMIDPKADIKITSMSLNKEYIHKDWSTNQASKHFIEIHPKKEKNLLAITVFHNNTKDTSQYSCEFNKNGRRCFVEVYLTKKGISCYDCVTD